MPELHSELIQKIPEVEAIVRQVMRSWSVYQESDKIVAHNVMDRQLFLAYNVEKDYHWHANVVGDVFYIGKLTIPDSMRGKGIGHRLYETLERVATALGCRRIQQTPVGQTPSGESRLDYLVRRGWRQTHNKHYELYKRLPETPEKDATSE